MKALLKLIFISAGFAANDVSAACKSLTSNGLNYYVAMVSGFSPPEFDPDSVPVGGVIYEATGAPIFNNKASSRATVSCSPGVYTYVAGAGVSDSSGIYPTAIPNIGIRILAGPNRTAAPFKGDYVVNTSWDENYPITVQLIKTGDITAGGVLNGAYAAYRAGSVNGDLLVEYRFTSPVVVQPRVPTCKVATPEVTVPMGAVATVQFKGVGTTTVSRMFDIVLNCSGGNLGTSTNAYVTLTDATVPTNTSTVLSLRKGSTASGVGMQIRRSGTLVGFGPDSAAVGNINQWHAGTITQGQSALTIPLSVSYVQTGATVTPGSANARATFTLSYQ
ncbi:TPA: type 1 fimbrial protein [Burkholderia cenocepacia]|uniref:fimbrial protein n=1 Tax=unclassified Burkholderia TaxID=2613784 RepID=UPI00158EC344|nr:MULTISPECIES: fimbrial protein [unclassified Burkholderia]HEF5869492.1 type 1 fimbrial protein [Burkholderia cenocepacia]